MKIIHCITSLRRGGAEKTLIRIINNSNMQHFVLTIFKDTPLKSELNKDVKIISLFPFTLKKLFYISNNIKAFAPDKIQGWMYHGDILATLIGWLINKPVYWNIRHGKMSIRYTSKLTITLRSLLALMSHFSPTKIISCSFEGYKVHKNIGYEAKKIVVIQNGMPKLKTNIETQRKIPSGKTIIRVGSIGRDSPQKRRELFIGIIKNLNKKINIKGVIIGRGVTTSKKINDLIGTDSELFDLKEEIDNIEEIYKSLDILIVCSNYGEGCPNVLLEGLQRGLCCFSTDVGDSKLILNNESFIIHNYDSEKASNSIFKKLQSDQLNKDLSNIRKSIASNLNIKNMVDKYEKLWEL